MRLFVSKQRAQKKRGSHIALAIALATGTALVSGLVAEPAQAQREKKKDRKKKGNSDYSQEFIVAYKPIEDAMNAGGDLSGLKSQFPTVVALAKTPAERMALGNLIYNVGSRTNDRDMQLQGMTMMLDSGNVTAEQAGQFNFVAYQLSNSAGNFADAQRYLQGAIDANFTTDTINREQMQIAMAELHFSQNQFAQGLAVLEQAIEAREAAGQTAEEQWYRRGLSIAYSNEVTPQVYDFAAAWIQQYPSPTNWRDAVNIARNLNTYQGGEILDLMRLAYRTDALQEKYEYIDYVDAADPRRLPREVRDVIERGYAKGHISRDDMYVSDALKTASGVIERDQAELPSLERDARGANARLATVMAAADTFLNYGEYAKAEEFYAKALNMAGADRNEVLTRLGIAQIEQGKHAEARATLDQVSGSRAPIATLWAAYAAQQAGGTATAATTAAVTN